MIRDSCTANGTRLYIDLGGEYGSPATQFENFVNTTALHDAYIQQVFDFCTGKNPDSVKFDGASIDWEWPSNNATTRTNTTTFLNKLRAKFNTTSPPLQIGFALGQWMLWNNNASTPVITAATINADIDWVFLMGYNTYSTSQLSHEAMLYDNPAIGGGAEAWDIRGIRQYTANGVDTSRIVYGTSGEILSMNISNTANAVPGAPGSGVSTTTPFSQMAAVYNAPSWDAVAQNSYWVSGTRWYSTENYNSAVAKINYVKNMSCLLYTSDAADE